ncbi:hypothetical protein OAA39_00305 [bacterium]|nr:hypothetical protein [bacterium]
MPGIFKKLSANDIKITPFEAHKQYDSVNLASIGAQTASLAWSGKNKSTFSTGSRQYYQIDKLYYRNYIQERANRLELDDATYTTQERRLYKSASLLSLSQKTFGSEVQPESFVLNITKGGITYNIQDDGFGNLYDTAIGKDNFPNEDNRVFYLAPINGFKRLDLTRDYETGNEYVNLPFPDGYSQTVYDDSYFQNVVTFEKTKFEDNTLGSTRITRFDEDDSDISRVTIENRPYLNFNDEDFCISFYYDATTATNNYSTSAGVGTLSYILTKEGTQNSAPLGSQAGGGFAMNVTGALDITTTSANPAYPYRVYCKIPSNGKIQVYLERFDGETSSLVSGSFYNTVLGAKHILLQKTGSKLQAYFNGVLESEEDDLTTKPCQNKADLLIFDKRNSDGSYYNGPDDWGKAFQPFNFQIWNRSMNTDEIAMVSESFTGTYPIGNLFYDNGFATLTHPKYMSLFDGGNLNTLKYKNTYLITENEYQCTMTEDEFEFTTNPTARKIPSIESEDIADFTTGSAFKPYVTTVGLHDDDGNLLVVGKLGQPIKASSETDTTFIIRFDT